MATFRVVEADLEQAGDAQVVLDLVDDYSQDPFGDGRPLLPETRRTLIDGLRSHPTTIILIAYVEDRPAGIAVCFRGFSTFAAKPLLNIHDFSVRPGFRGQRVGQRLMEAVEHKARELGCCKLTLEVLESNTRARRVYAGAGFAGEPVGGLPGSTLFLSKRLC